MAESVQRIVSGRAPKSSASTECRGDHHQAESAQCPYRWAQTMQRRWPAPKTAVASCSCSASLVRSFSSRPPASRPVRGGLGAAEGDDPRRAGRW